MMQAAEPGHGDYLASHPNVFCCRPTLRCSLPKAKMGSVVLVIVDVHGHQAPQMLLIEHDDVIKQIPAAAAYEALGNAVLPRTAEAGLLGFDTKALDGADNLKR